MGGDIFIKKEVRDHTDNINKGSGQRDSASPIVSHHGHVRWDKE